MRRPGAAHLKNASMHFFLWPKENALGALKRGNLDGSPAAAQQPSRGGEAQVWKFGQFDMEQFFEQFMAVG